MKEELTEVIKDKFSSVISVIVIHHYNFEKKIRKRITGILSCAGSKHSLEFINLFWNKLATN